MILYVMAGLLALSVLTGIGGWWKGNEHGKEAVTADWDAQKAKDAAATAKQAAVDAAINERIGNELEAERRKAIDLGALSARRLRDLTAARSAAAAACSRLDEPAAGLLPDRTRIDLESLADRADETARALEAWQQRERELGGAQGSGLKVKP